MLSCITNSCLHSWGWYNVFVITVGWCTCLMTYRSTVRFLCLCIVRVYSTCLIINAFGENNGIVMFTHNCRVHDQWLVAK